MKILSVTALPLPGVRVYRFQRFQDLRGYFTETFRYSDFPMTFAFAQANESRSLPGVIRGLHFQYAPWMGKLVRTVHGRMVDIILDIRKGSPTYGKAILYEMPASLDQSYSEWIWVPPGFAHGNFFSVESIIEYFCTAEFVENTSLGISPLAEDIDWSLSDPRLKIEFNHTLTCGRMTFQDRFGPTVRKMADDERLAHIDWKELM